GCYRWPYKCMYRIVDHIDTCHRWWHMERQQRQCHGGQCEWGSNGCNCGCSNCHLYNKLGLLQDFVDQRKIHPWRYSRYSNSLCRYDNDIDQPYIGWYVEQW